MYATVEDESEAESESSDEQEVFLEDEDYDLERDVGLKREVHKQHENKEYVEDKVATVVGSMQKYIVQMSRENDRPASVEMSMSNNERRYRTRRKQIDFSKMLANELGEEEEPVRHSVHYSIYSL